MMTFGKDASARYLVPRLEGKRSIVLVTGRTSYAVCGAEAFLSPFLAQKNIVHLTTVGENARAEDVAEKKSQLPEHVDAYIAVWGGDGNRYHEIAARLGRRIAPILGSPDDSGYRR